MSMVASLLVMAHDCAVQRVCLGPLSGAGWVLWSSEPERQFTRLIRKLAFLNQ